jgi:hypothetical protein
MRRGRVPLVASVTMMRMGLRLGRSRLLLQRVQELLVSKVLLVPEELKRLRLRELLLPQGVPLRGRQHLGLGGGRRPDDKGNRQQSQKTRQHG